MFYSSKLDSQKFRNANIHLASNYMIWFFEYKSFSRKDTPKIDILDAEENMPTQE